MAGFDNDPLGQEFLLEQLSRIIVPRKLNIKLRCELIHTQHDEEIPRFPGRDFQSAEFGEVMGDVVSRIQKDLKLFVDLDLLVGGKLINYDLPIELVYRKVFLPTQKGEFDASKLHSAEFLPTMRII